MEDRNLETTHTNYNSQDPTWEKLLDCYIGGGNIYNADDEKYLIKKGIEDSDDYDARKIRSKYYNKCYQIISTFQGHLWRKSPIRELPDDLLPYLIDVDRNNTTANEFFQDITQWSQVYGVYFVLVDYPPLPEVEGELSKREEEELGLRPYFVEINPSNLLDWGFRAVDDGSEQLDYVVIRETVVNNDQPFFKTKSRTQYRLIRPYVIQIWRYKEEGNTGSGVEMIAEYENTLGEIPLVPFYSKKEDFAVGRSVLHDIVDLNLELYNKHSDKDTCEYWTAHPQMFFKGFTRNELTTSPAHGVFTENTDADFKIVEFSGTSIAELRTTETDILREIYDIALKQIRNPSVARQTYESKRLDRIDALTELQARALGYSESEQKCWEYAAKWLNLDPGKINVEYNIDFNVEELTTDLIRTLLELKGGKVISKNTLWKLLMEGEVLPATFNAEEEEKLILAEPNESTTTGTEE